MPEYTDPAGNVWHPRLTFSVIKLIERQTGARLLSLEGAQTLSDVDVLLKAFFCSFQDEAKERKIGLEEFRQIMDPGPAKPMIAAFNAAVAEFMEGTQDEAEEKEEADPTQATPGD